MRSAASGRKLNMVRFLLARGASPNPSGDEAGPICAAVTTRYDEPAMQLTKELIRSKVKLDVHCRNQKYDYTPLIYAVQERRQKLASQLLYAGASVDFPNKAGHTALRRAIAAEHWREARFLLSRGARPHKTGWLDVMPLFGSVEATFKVFRKALPAVGPVKMSDLMTVSQKMANWSEDRYRAIQGDSSHAFHIMKAGLSPYAVDHRGMTALEGAWRAHQIPILVALLEEGVGGLQEQIDKLKADLRAINSARNAKAINEIIGADPVLGPILNLPAPKCEDDYPDVESDECDEAWRKHKAARMERLREGVISGEITTSQALGMFYVLSRTMSLDILTKVQRQRRLPPGSRQR
ncbi:MAG: hypothetical protein KJO07_10050 [Deltaproteobacteria bacterium]|nr:hypothetical protein [Deltaproteobacteria bacterium]